MAAPALRSLKGLSRNTASGANTETIASTSPRSQPRPNVSRSSRYACIEANIPQSGTSAGSVWYTGRDHASPPNQVLSSSTRNGGCDDVEADSGRHGRAGLLCAATRGAGPRRRRRRRDDDHGPGNRPQLLHHQRRVGRGPQGGRALRDPVERRHDLRPGELEAGRSPELEAGPVRRGEGEGDGHAPVRERPAHDRDQDGLGRELMRRRLAGGAAVAVAALGGNVLVTEETGEGVVFDTAGHALREWQSPDYASLYAAAGTRIAAVRSPYRVPVLGEGVAADTAPLIRMLDTLGRQVAGLASARVPALPLLTAIVNAGATAVGPDGAVYFAPLVQDEIRKYAPGGALRWATRRGLFRRESDPEFLPQKGGRLELRKALVNVALVLAPH